MASSKNRRALVPNSKDHLNSSEYFMATALLAAQNSKDPATKVGACIVNKDNEIVSVGYNHMPKHSDAFPWGKESKHYKTHKKFYVCHAEMNAILKKNSVDIHGCTLYVTLFPCNECAKKIIESGIKEIIYYADETGWKQKDTVLASKHMLEVCEIPFRRETFNHMKVNVECDEVNNAE